MEIKQEIIEQIRENQDPNIKTVTEVIRNKAELVGTIDTELTFAYEIRGEGIFRFVLKVPRLRKDVFDYINVEVPERGMNLSRFSQGDKVRVIGQFRSINKKDINEDKGHLILSLFLSSMEPETTTYKVNDIKLHGHICKEPNLRTTKTGKDICDLILAVNRNYDRCDYIPCITWGRDAKYASTLSVGSKVYIVGRIQSRDYNKKFPDGTVEVRTAYEVSVAEIQETEEDSEVTETREV